MSNDESLISFGNEGVQKLLDLAKEKEWEHVTTEDDIVVDRKEQESGRYYWRGNGKINGLPHEIANFLMDPSTPEFDEKLQKCDILRTILDDRDTEGYPKPVRVTLEHSYYDGIWPTSPRDFVYLTVCYQVKHSESDGPVIAIAEISVDSLGPEKCPEIEKAKDYVRALITCGSGWVFMKDTSVNEPTTLVTRILDVDPQGSIPSFIVNRLGKEEPMVIKDLRKAWEVKKEEGGKTVEIFKG